MSNLVQLGVGAHFGPYYSYHILATMVHPLLESPHGGTYALPRIHRDPMGPSRWCLFWEFLLVFSRWSLEYGVLN